MMGEGDSLLRVQEANIDERRRRSARLNISLDHYGIRTDHEHVGGHDSGANMRVSGFCAFIALVTVVGALASPTSSQTVGTTDADGRVYFLIDHSRSMAGGVNWLDVQDGVSSRLATIRQSRPSAQVSISHVAGDVQRGCQTPIEIAPFMSAAAVKLAFGEPSGSTVIGSALQAAIVSAGSEPATIYIYTDGSETCVPQICEVAEGYLVDRSNISVEIFFTEDTTFPDRERLDCVRASQVRMINEGKASEATLGSAMPVRVPEIRQITFWQKWYWLLPAAFGSGAATLFAIHFGRRRKTVQDQIIEVQSANTSEDQNAVLAKLKTETSSTSVARRFQINNTKFSAAAWFLAILASLCVFPMIFFEYEFMIAARRASWAFLDSNFGTYAFAATTLALAGFAAMQYWLFREAQNDLLLESGAMRRAREERRSQQRERLFQAYNQLTDQVGSLRLTVSRPNFWNLKSYSFGSDKLEVLQNILLTRAIAPPRLLAEMPEADEAKQIFDRLRQYASTRDIVRFAKILREDKKITFEQLKMIENIENEAYFNRGGKIEQLLQELLDELTMQAAVERG